MVTTPIIPQQLSAGYSADNDDNGKGEWGFPQIATPVAIGGGFLLVLFIYFIWKRRPHTKRQYDYQQVRSDWTSRLERVFGHQRRRQRVLHSSVSVTLDDSMRTASYMFDFNRRSRQTRSDSTDSETPLTAANFAFEYPPNNPPPPIPKRPMVRWWWLLGSRPKQVKSQEPTQRWHVDDADGSSTGHGHSSHGHRYARGLMSLYEDPEEGEDRVNRMKENSNLVNVASTFVTRQLREQVGIMPTIPEHPQHSGTPTPPRAASAPQSIAGTPISSERGLPPSYDVSQSQSHYPSTENGGRHLYSGPYIPPPERVAGYSSPRMFHGRALSSDSFLVTQPPMVATSTY